MSRASPFYDAISDCGHEIVIRVTVFVMILNETEEWLLMFLLLWKYSASAHLLLLCIGYRPPENEQKWPSETRHFISISNMGILLLIIGCS